MSVGLSSLDGVDSPFAPCLASAVSTLRNQIELHVHREQQLRTCYLGMQQSWQSHCEQMTSQISIPEGLLATWMQPMANTPQLQLVSGPDHD